MNNRRNFGRIAVASVLTLTTQRAVTQPITTSEYRASQLDYIFFANERDRTEARTIAETFLTQLDSAHLVKSEVNEIYSRSSELLKKRYSETAFMKRISLTRTPLGTPKTRVFEGIDGGFRRLPNLVDGEYLIVIFNTIFDKISDIYTEQVTLERNRQTGRGWQLVEYFSDKKPYYEY